MAEVGELVQGTVVRLLNYGVLLKLEDGGTGLVHISEIDNSYVHDVSDYFQINDNVTAKVLAAGDRGKLELSVKQARAALNGEPVIRRGETPVEPPPPNPEARREPRTSFEDKMNDFMRSSAERLSDLKRNIEKKRGGKKPR